MRPELWALAAAVLWAVGAFFGKRGMTQAGLEPQQGLLVRLWVSALVLIAVAAPRLAGLVGALTTLAGRRGVGQIALFEGLVAGTLGMLAFYTALRHGALSRVIPIAFTTPLRGFLLGVVVAGEPFSWTKALGVAAVLIGIVLLNV
ncbi:MAG: EamA family transporter [Candidatus Bipolaricaulaceae bacterium]